MSERRRFSGPGWPRPDASVLPSVVKVPMLRLAVTRGSSVCSMSEVSYVSRVRIERLGGPQRLAYLPAEKDPVLFGVHSEVAEHYGVSADQFPPHATTLDYVVAAAGG